jgi:hypothetical protein
VILRQHRFEVGVAALAAMAAIVMGMSIAIRIAGLGITDDCLERIRATQDGRLAGPECFALVQAGDGILGETYLDGEGTIALSVMGVLPFLVGLLGGVPVVARELEVGTAQTAWWLNGSRNRWLLRQITPITILLGTLMIVSAFVATIVADDWVRWIGARANLIGTEGIVVVIRAFAAFGIGLAVGALLGRTLPAFVLGLALSIAMLFALGQAQQAWQASLPPHPLGQTDPGTGEQTDLAGSVTTAWGWIAPDGQVLSQSEARQIATAAGVAPPDPDDVQDTPAALWLSEHGYEGVQMGVTDEDAMGWATYDGLAFGAVGLIAVGGAFVLVNRRRPS